MTYRQQIEELENAIEVGNNDILVRADSHKEWDKLNVEQLSKMQNTIEYRIYFAAKGFIQELSKIINDIKVNHGDELDKEIDDV